MVFQFSLVGLVAKSCLTLVTPWTAVHQVLLSLEFPSQEYWSELPFLSLSHPGIKPGSPALQVDSLPTELGWNLKYISIIFFQKPHIRCLLMFSLIIVPTLN